MSRELLLLRHAKSAWDTAAATDFDRPLANRGLKAAPRVGRFMAEQGLEPDYIVSSPAQRARQTVVLACAELGISEAAVQWDRRIYHAGIGTLMEVLRDAPKDAHCVLMVGHNPGFENLLQSLCVDEIPMPDDWKLMPTAALARLEIKAPWPELDYGAAALISLTRARSLARF